MAVLSGVSFTAMLPAVPHDGCVLVSGIVNDSQSFCVVCWRIARHDGI
jgi:hypothetical protein